MIKIKTNILKILIITIIQNFTIHSMTVRTKSNELIEAEKKRLEILIAKLTPINSTIAKISSDLNDIVPEEKEKIASSKFSNIETSYKTGKNLKNVDMDDDKILNVIKNVISNKLDELYAFLNIKK